MASASTLASWIPDKKPKANTLGQTSVFYRRLEETLDTRRAAQNLFSIRQGPRAEPDSADFATLDVLSLASSGTIRDVWLKELQANTDFKLSEGGSRLMCNSTYTDDVEKDIAEFHNAEKALIFHSGWDANGAILTAIPRPGDTIVFDELIHASTHEGMRLSLALNQVSFKHNSVDNLRETLHQILETQPQIKSGRNCILICVESMYSMDGDVAPLREMVDCVKAMFPMGNAQFIVDEAHTTGIVGRQGRGLVCHLGLEREIAIRMHTYGKALAASGGAAVLCNSTIQSMLINFGPIIIYSAAPQFSLVAAIKSAYTLMRSGQTQPLQDRVQYLLQYFFEKLTQEAIYDEAVEDGILHVPLADEWESHLFLSHILAIFTRQRYNNYLFFHLQLAGISAFCIDYPVVPKGKSRLRLVFHANNTESEVDTLVAAMCSFAKEMLAIEANESDFAIPTAARQVFALQA